MKSVTIPEHILQSTRMSQQEIMTEMAVMLFQKGKLTLGQASELAETPQLQFQHLLASRHISVHYDVADFEKDLKTLRELGRM